jgi:hypothetical protein
MWYTGAPKTFSSNGPIALDSLDVAGLLPIAIAIVVYTLFCAWLLSRFRGLSSFQGMMLILFSWLFMVLPNFVFVSVLHDFGSEKVGYLLSLGGACALTAAVILPFWRSTRSIFKD